MVDWKKEIKFGGDKNDDANPEESGEQTSIWKKEISFGRKKDSQPKEQQPEPAEQQQPATPIWKKEISFRRKPKEPVTPDFIVLEPEFEHTPQIEDQPAAVELLHAYVPEPIPVAEPPAAHVEEPAPVVEQPTEVFAAPEPEPTFELVAVDPEPQPEPLAPEFVLVSEPDPPAETAPVEAQPETAPFEPQAQIVDLTPPPALTVEPQIVDLTPQAVAPAPPPAPPAPPVLPFAPPPIAAVPEPVVVHPPVPAAQLPPLAEEKPAAEPKEGTSERVPFYKRELSFGRKDKAPKEPKQKKEKEKKPKAEKPAKAEKAEQAEKTEKAEKPKRERRSLSIPRPAPRGSRGGGGKLPKRLVGLKIGASQLAAATVSNDGHAEVLQVARQDLDPGIVSAGELREPDLLADALKEFFNKNKLPKRGVRLGIATNRIGVRTLEISGIDDPKQLANAIRFRAQEALPIPIDEAVLDYQVLSESKNEEGETVRRILLVLAYRDLIDRYVSACKKAGITLAGIDLEAFALLRALAAPREESVDAQAALVAVTVGHDRTTFAVSDGRVCEFTRVLDWGGHSLNVGLARALDQAPSEVEKIKRSLSLDGTEVPEGLSAEQASTAREALRRQVQTFARELVSSLQFYQNQPGSLGIGEIVLTGGTAHLHGLADELQKLIGVRVRVGDPLVRVKVGKKLRDPEQIGSLAVAIGLGIED